MLSYTDLKPGTTFVLEGAPWEVREYRFVRLQQRKPTVQTKIKNLISGKIVARSFAPSDTLPEANIERKPAIFLYYQARNQEYWFHAPDNPKNRFMLKEDAVGNLWPYLTSNTEVQLYEWEGRTINVGIPIKMDLCVKEAPPAVKGDTAQGGTKEVILETGLKINVPLFINEGDVVRINTESGEYVERVSKG
jgi:elongation factor P